MTSKKRLISLVDLDSVRARYGVPMEVELLTARHDERYKDQRLGFICVNEFVLKFGVKLPFKFGVVEVLNAYEVIPIQLMPNLGKIIQAVSRLCEWMRVVLTFFNLNDVKWFDSKQTFFQYCRREEIQNPCEAALAPLSARVLCLLLRTLSLSSPIFYCLVLTALHYLAHFSPLLLPNSSPFIVVRYHCYCREDDGCPYHKDEASHLLLLVGHNGLLHIKAHHAADAYCYIDSGGPLITFSCHGPPMIIALLSMPLNVQPWMPWKDGFRRFCLFCSAMIEHYPIWSGGVGCMLLSMEMHTVGNGRQI
ncbi:hypothetical protein ACLOJK_041384 [Asimina triloba]